MHVYGSRTLIEIWTPAKLNLFLEIKGRRPDGFHELEMLMVPVSLFDTLYASSTCESILEFSCRWAAGLRRSCTGSEDACLGRLPDVRQNLAYRAFELVRQKYHVAAGARVRLIKRIPSSAGLGGASSDAAAALVAASRVWNLDLSIGQLDELAWQLGSDVSFFLRSCPGICRGRGELVEPLPGGSSRLAFVVVRPREGLSTADVYNKVCPPPVEDQRSVQHISRLLRDGCVAKVGQSLFNRLQPAAEQLSAWIGRLQRQLHGQDVVGHLMSGSGSSYFAVCRSWRHARAIRHRLWAKDMGLTYAVTSTSFTQTRLRHEHHSQS
jgi:4-diphosphocytidyl-2-C-methyl-D-erythritol kinase